MTARECIELVAAWTVPLAIPGLIVERVQMRKRLGVRAIQFLAVATFAPVVVILALEKIIDGGTVSALVGYLFSNIAEFDRRESRKAHHKGPQTPDAAEG